MEIWLSLTFLLLIALLISLDLGVLSRRPRIITSIEAGASLALWTLTAAGVSLLLAKAYQNHWLGLGTEYGSPLTGSQALWQFITAYAAELALSLDNVALLALIFDHFRVRAAHRNRVLFWTILISVFLRAAMVLLGAALFRFEGMHLAFALVLAIATVRTLVTPDEQTLFDNKPLVRIVRRIPVWSVPEDHRLTTRADGRLRGTPLVAVVLTAAAADFTFALDSVPAAFAVTRDPLIALSSNILAVLTLRSLYFWLADIIGRLRFLRIALTLVLGILTVKMLLGRYSSTATIAVLAAIGGVMAVGVAGSLWRARRGRMSLRPRPAPIDDVTEAVVITRRNFRKVLVLIAGTSVLLLAVLIGWLPGPGFLILAPIGLAILASEFLWARRLLQRLKDQSAAIQKQAGSLASRTPIWTVPLAFAAYAAAVSLLLTTQTVWPEWVPVKLVWSGMIGALMVLGYWAWTVIQAGRARRRSQRGGSVPGASKAAPHLDSPPHNHTLP